MKFLIDAQLPPTLADAPIVWLRVGNSSRRALLRQLLPQMPDVLGALQSGANLVEIRS